MTQIDVIRMSIHDACLELFADREMRLRAYKIISSTVETELQRYNAEQQYEERLKQERSEMGVK